MCSRATYFFLSAERAEFGAFLGALPGPYLVLEGEPGTLLGCGGYAIRAGTTCADLGGWYDANGTVRGSASSSYRQVRLAADAGS
jgi:hypothetical protein